MLLYALGGRAVLDRVRRRARGHVVERTLGVVLLRHRRGDGHQPRRPLRGGAGQGHEPAGDPRRPDARRWRTRTRSRTGSPRCGRRRGSPRASARRRPRRSPPAVGVSIPGVKTPSLPKLGRRARLHQHPAVVQHPRRPAADASPACAATWCWSTSGPTPASTASARCRSSRACTPPITATASTSSASRRRSSRSSRRRATSQQAIHSDGLRYPVVQDNRYGTWNAYQNQYWPAEYLIDANGQVRHTQFGEGDYKQDEAAVRELLYEAGARNLPPPMTAHAIMPSSGLETPETYLNPQRAQGFAQPLKSGTHSYPGVSSLQLNEFAPHGHLERQLPVGHAGVKRRHDHGRLPGRPRLPGDDLGRQLPRTGPGAARRPADLGRRLRGRRARRPGHGQGPAAVLAGLAARRPAARLHAP